MSFKELFEEQKFKSVFREIEEFSNIQLEAYNNKLEEIELTESGKEIFDAVWGNVPFTSGEIYILDSPLLQRLRYIKQLGLASFVYCGGDYSRFYHTIGVVFLSDKMAKTINKCELGISGDAKSYFKAVIRLSAIFHDSGHMFLSHASEHYFAKSPLYHRSDLVGDMLEDFEKKTGKHTSLHELLSCMLVNTASVKRLLKRVVAVTEGSIKSTGKEIDKLVEYMSSFIVGVPVDGDSLPYSSIINGPIDADKCDYLSRDSHVSRVPVAVDISRITQKLSVVEVKNINQSELWHGHARVNDKLYELAMQDSAEKALFQLCIARTIMFDSVYYHHKVLTAEIEFRNILNMLSNLKDPIFKNFTEILCYTDGDFNKYFLDTLKEGREQEDIECLDLICEKLQKLYQRVLAKRVVCLMPEYLKGRQGDKEALFDLVLTGIDTDEEKLLIENIKKEYSKVCGLLDLKDLSLDEINIYFIQAPTTVFGHSKIRVPIDLRNGGKREFKGYELVSSRETSSSASHIVTNASKKELVYFALEKVLYERFRIILERECISCGKFNQEDFLKYSVKLFELNYYHSSPKLIKDEIVFNCISMEKIKNLTKKYATYEGPKGHNITEEGVKDFFKQIMSFIKQKNHRRNIMDGIYNMLEDALFINRKYLTSNIGKILERIDYKNEVLYVIPLGSNRDSAKHMTYFWNDIKYENFRIETEKSLEEVLELSEENPIVFFDDGSFSGVQLTSIMQEYLGICDKKTDEHHVEALPNHLHQAFKNKKIVYFYIAFNVVNEDKIKEELSSIGLNDVTFLFVDDMSSKYLEGKEIFKDENQRKQVKEFLEYVGFEIMEFNKKENGKYRKKWNAERVRKSALGYNDAQQMVFLKSSVPTYTITAFWEKGKVNGVEWEPLFKRTLKP